MTDECIEFLESFGMDSEQGKKLLYEIRNLHLEEARKEAEKEGYSSPTLGKLNGYTNFVQSFAMGAAMSTIKIGMGLIHSRSVDYDTISFCLEIPYELVKRLAYFHKHHWVDNVRFSPAEFAKVSSMADFINTPIERYISEAAIKRAKDDEGCFPLSKVIPIDKAYCSSHKEGVCFMMEVNMSEDTFKHLERMAENEKMGINEYASKIINEYVAKEKKELAAFIERHNKWLKEELERSQKVVQVKNPFKINE